MAETNVDATPTGSRIATIARITLWSWVYDALLAIPGGWVLMLTIGLVHHQWWPGMPTIGYLTAAALIFLIRQIITALTSQERSFAREKAALQESL